MQYTSHITNPERLKFMTALATDVFGPNGLLVEDWERGFVASFRASSRPSLWFIGGRLESTDKLWRKYGLEINLPFPPPLAAPQDRTIKADVDGCEFIVMDRSRWPAQHPCNEPATKVNSRGFRYCDTHGEQAQKAMARRGGRMELRTYLPKKIV